jgi:hypothetical protein
MAGFFGLSKSYVMFSQMIVKQVKDNKGAVIFLFSCCRKTNRNRKVDLVFTRELESSQGFTFYFLLCCSCFVVRIDVKLRLLSAFNPT